jgi:hypothetical protein
MSLAKECLFFRLGLLSLGAVQKEMTIRSSDATWMNNYACNLFQALSV